MHATALLIGLPFAFTVALLYLLPSLARRDQFFGVTVQPAFRRSPEAQHMVHHYRLQVLLHAALGLGGIGLTLRRNAPLGLAAALLWPVAGSMLAIVLAHRSALPHAVPASGLRVASLQPRSRSWPGGFFAWVGPFAILGSAALFAGLHWAEIPPRFPIHWGMDGQPNGWRERSPMGVFGFELFGTLICLSLLAMVRELIGNSRGSAAALRTSVLTLLAVAYGLAALFAWVTCLPVLRSAPKPAGGILVTVGILATVVVGLMLTLRARRYESSGTARPGESVPVDDPPPGNAPVGDNSADSRWLGGVLYFNPDDPAVLVEKRVGIGYSLNFGNPRSWGVIVVLLLVPVAIALLQ